ncbi:MAG: hypothetical protein ACM3QU_03895 [Verrucomicrobiota bacterium]
MAGTTLNRRRLLASGAAAAGALAIPTVARAKPKTQSIFKLVANGATCRACLSHDAASLFPTAKAANGNRAHVGCNCTVVQGSIDYGTFVALFGDPHELRSYRADLRSTRNEAIIKNHEPVFPA